MSLAEEEQKTSARTTAESQRTPKRRAADAPAPAADAEQPAFDDRGAEPAVVAPRPRSKR